MGTDIHPVLWIPRLDRKGACGWSTVRNESGTMRKRDADDRCPLVRDRNYTLFAILGHECRGNQKLPKIETHEGFPEHFEMWASGHCDRYCAKNCTGLHSIMDDIGDYGFRWVTVAKLKEYPWQLLPDTAKEDVRDFFERAVPWMELYSKDAILVFGFDN